MRAASSKLSVVSSITVEYLTGATVQRTGVHGLVTVALPEARQRAGSSKRSLVIVNNNDLADTIAEGTGVTKADARKIVDAVFVAIGDAAAKGEEISLNGFGKFKVKDSPEREGRNPATGEAMTIKASKKLTFTVAKAVKDKLNG
jgi:DNA-binding protein HU-beta